MDKSAVTTSSEVTNFEELSGSGYGYGSDTGGGNTLQLLQDMSERFGPVASFSGSYRADRWKIKIEREGDKNNKHSLILIINCEK